jgi:hypothetical protein
LLPVDEKRHEAGGHQNGEYDQNYLFHDGCVLQVSPISVYAIPAVTVPALCKIDSQAGSSGPKAGWAIPGKPGRRQRPSGRKTEEASWNQSGRRFALGFLTLKEP